MKPRRTVRHACLRLYSMPSHVTLPLDRLIPRLVARQWVRAALCPKGQEQGEPGCRLRTAACLLSSSLASLQFAEVRSDAEARMAKLMGDIAQRLAARAGGECAVGADPTAELRGRLEAAIQVMQEGLVERDTEVRPLARPGACTAPVRGMLLAPVLVGSAEAL